LGSLAVVVFIFANIPADTSGSESKEWIELFNNFITKVLSGYESSISKSNISLIGTILTFILFVSGYFVFESHRKMKNQINKLG
jgi:predicted PurR-regulated permease PerM